MPLWLAYGGIAEQLGIYGNEAQNSSVPCAWFARTPCFRVPFSTYVIIFVYTCSFLAQQGLLHDDSKELTDEQRVEKKRCVWIPSNSKYLAYLLTHKNGLLITTMLCWWYYSTRNYPHYSLLVDLVHISLLILLTFLMCIQMQGITNSHYEHVCPTAKWMQTLGEPVREEPNVFAHRDEHVCTRRQMQLHTNVKRAFVIPCVWMVLQFNDLLRPLLNFTCIIHEYNAL